MSKCSLFDLDFTKIIEEAFGTSVDRLRELAQADKEGKIPKYTIGDTIYDRFGDAWEVRTAELHLLGEKPDWMYRCGHAGTDDYCALWSFEILTCEDAEAALRREQDGVDRWKSTPRNEEGEQRVT